ncbi:hypothetical protein ACQJBY_039303 [Aegilops geniculata]
MTASNPGCSCIGRELPTILPDPDDLVGIEGPTNELEGWLINGEEQLKVVSIVGVAGIGKTALALKLWGKLHGQFECGAFVRTAQKPDMRGILRNILLQVRQHQPPNHGEMRHLINDLREYLQDKRYFIIIDDLWATSVWDVVSRAFPQSDHCSRIITTTEIMEVALACRCFCSEHIFKMEPLSDDDSEKLLLQRILVSGNQSPQQFDDVIPQIMRSCGGLPLAIIIVARILASQPEKLEQWGSTQNSFDSIFRAKPTMEGFMGQILNIYFINLPRYLKTCLLHLSTYPEGYLFLKEDLVKQWVAEGFICANEGEDMEEVAGCYFEELFCMGLIQAMDINCDYELLSYSVHQLVLDLITYKSIEENFITVVDYSQTTIPLADKVRRLSLHFGSATCATTPESTRLSQVRSLFFSGLFNCMPSFMVFKLLRVLILHLWDDTGTKTLSLAGICELFRLRYLQVICNVTVKLPDKIEGMKHLETLQINAQVLDILPDIVSLPSLLHLSLRGANLPSGIGCIRSLRTLMYFDLGNSSEDNLWSLGELTNLRDLHLTYSSSLSSEHLKRNLIALASSLRKLCNLKSLTLAAGTTGTAGTVVHFDGSSGMSAPFFLESLEFLPPICIFSRLPKWIGQLRKICIMKVAVRELPMSDIATLTGLPSLTVLWLSVQTAPEGRIVFNDRAFPVLKYFKFSCGVLCMSFMAGAMPNLRRLKLGFNAHTGKKYDNMLAGIEHLLTLQYIAAQIGATTESDWRAAESAINNAIDKHPRFPRSNLQWVDPIEQECRPSEKHHWSQEKGSLGFDINVLLREARSRWLKPSEVYHILLNHEQLQITHEPPNKPHSGSLFLYNRRVNRLFRKDGYAWRRKKDGRTVGEAHERLKVGNVDAMSCYYAHGEQNPYFQRRCLWMLEPAYDHIVLVQYREVAEGRYHSTLSNESAESLSKLSHPNDLHRIHGSTPDFSEGNGSSQSSITEASSYSANKEYNHDTRLTLTRKQQFSIREISPEWAFCYEITKVIITGDFLCDPSNICWAVMFGDTEVPAEIVQPGVLRCRTPLHSAGKLTLCITTGNMKVCSEFKDFEFCAKSTASSFTDLAPSSRSMKSTEELSLLAKFARILLRDNGSSAVSGDDPQPGQSPKVQMNEENWQRLINALDVGCESPLRGVHWIMEELLKSKLQQWLSLKLQGDEGTCSLSKNEQGIMHLISVLGYDWALSSVLGAGVGINLRDSNGWTALHWAAYFGREKMVAALLAAGASAPAVTDPTAQNPVGKTAAFLASERGHMGLATYLSEVSLTSDYRR